MNRPSRYSSRAWCFETFPFGSIRSLPCTRPTLISFLSKGSRRSAPPFSLMTIVNIVGGSGGPTTVPARLSKQPTHRVNNGVGSAPFGGRRHSRRTQPETSPLLASWPAGRVTPRLHFARHLSEKLASQRDDVTGSESTPAKLPVNCLRQDGKRAWIACAGGFSER